MKHDILMSHYPCYDYLINESEVNIMDYKIVELPEMTVCGLSARTNNSSPDMGKIIGGLWQQFYGGIFQQIGGKKSDYAMGIYTDYASDNTGDYTVMTAYETDGSSTPEGTVTRTFPAGKYAEFTVVGNMVTAVSEFWQELWKLDLPRSYVFDFEQYRSGDCDNCEIHIFIGLKD